jgi:ABC-type Zn uptake system ZnuABC Zn-binding protein ZnuA
MFPRKRESYFLKVLVDDAAKLHALYPTNAENIKQEQTAVIESWSDLQTRAAQKKEELQAACDFHRFSSAVSYSRYLTLKRLNLKGYLYLNLSIMTRSET